MANPDCTAAYEIRLPRLNKLTPTLDSTLFKVIEEAGELARNVLAFLPYERLPAAELTADQKAALGLRLVAEELLDVAQTCVSGLFVLEEQYQVAVADLVGRHLDKLAAKGYFYDNSQAYRVTSQGGWKYLCLPRLDLPGIDLLKTTCKIQEEIGEATQYWGKGRGASGEPNVVDQAEIVTNCSLELLDIAQCCFTMMYILQRQYDLDIKELVAAHINKLRNKGYCR